MLDTSANTALESKQEKFERLLSQEPFKGIKAILKSLSPDREALYEGVNAATSYEDLLARLGFTVIVTKQIHVQDCYSRTGPAGGIKTVLPYHDIPTHSSLPTLVNYNSSVTTTVKSSAFFNQMLLKLKAQMNGKA
jgi:hypothetical protein